MTPHLLARRAAVGLAAAATLTLAACGSGTTTGSAGSTTSTASPASSAAASVTTSASTGAMETAHNAADVTFAQQMIVHHRGAIEMADLAATRANSQQVKDLAADIKAAQAPEIQQMTGWLQAWGTGPDMSGMPNTTTTTTTSSGGGTGMNHGGTAGTQMMPSGSGPADAAQMPGMMTADEMTQLTAATGAAFDRLFLQMMIVHHQGAVQMADTELAQGINADAQALAGSIKSSQTQQIATMEQLLTTL